MGQLAGTLSHTLTDSLRTLASFLGSRRAVFMQLSVEAVVAVPRTPQLLPVTGDARVAC